MKPLRLKFARPTTAWWANSVPALGLFGFAVLLFWNTLDHQFVFDDFTLIVQNPAVTEQQWSRLLSFHSYRPLRTLTYAAQSCRRRTRSLGLSFGERSPARLGGRAGLRPF